MITVERLLGVTVRRHWDITMGKTGVAAMTVPMVASWRSKVTAMSVVTVVDAETVVAVITEVINRFDDLFDLLTSWLAELVA